MDVIEIIESLAVTLASLAAIVGIFAWRREFLGKRRIELAEELLVGFYEADDAISSMRSPMSYQSEGRTRKRGQHETPEQQEALDNAYVLLERYQAHSELWSRLGALRYQCMARFGKGAEEPFKVLNHILAKLRVSARSLGRLWSDPIADFADPDKKRETEEHRQRLESVFWEGPASEDPIRPKVEQMISTVENLCRPVIEAASGSQPLWPFR